MVSERLPLFPLGTVLFPGTSMGLHVFEPRYRQLVEDLVARRPPRVFGIVAIREGHEVGADSVRALYDVGCVAELSQVERTLDGRFAIAVVGGSRFRLRDIDRSSPYLQADVELLDEPGGEDATAFQRLAAAARDALARYGVLLPHPAPALELPSDPTALSYAVASRLVVDLPERQRMLAAPDTAQRLRIATELMAREVALTRELRATPMQVPPVPRDRLN